MAQEKKTYHIHPHEHNGIVHIHAHEHGQEHKKRHFEEHHGQEGGEAILNVAGVNFGYHSHSVLKDINVKIERGEIMTILGPNGVGKSTLLKCMNMILKPKTGVIMLDKNDLTKLSGKEIAKSMGYVAQKNDCARMTIFDAVLLGRKPHIGWRIKSKDYEIVDKALKQLGLYDMQMRHIDAISGGEMQRVSICRAIVQEPSVLLLDEPTSALDLCRQIDILKVIKRVVETHNIATVMTMHDLNLALRFADRFVFMKEGKIYAACDRDGVTEEIIENVYGIEVDVLQHKGMPIVIPVG